MSATPKLIYLQGTEAAGASAVGNGTPVTTAYGHGHLSVEVVGTFTGTVTFEGTVDGSAWYPVGLKPWADTAAVTSTTAAGVFKLPTDTLLNKFRARISALSAGTVTVRGFALSRNV
jgi:hypothetical protein